MSGTYYILLESPLYYFTFLLSSSSFCAHKTLMFSYWRNFMAYFENFTRYDLIDYHFDIGIQSGLHINPVGLEMWIVACLTCYIFEISQRISPLLNIFGNLWELECLSRGQRRLGSHVCNHMHVQRCLLPTRYSYG